MIRFDKHETQPRPAAPKVKGVGKAAKVLAPVIQQFVLQDAPVIHPAPVLQGGKSVLVSMRFSPDLLRAIDARAAEQGLTRSDALRMAVERWLGALSSD